MLLSLLLCSSIVLAIDSRYNIPSLPPLKRGVALNKRQIITTPSVGFQSGFYQGGLVQPLPVQPQIVGGVYSGSLVGYQQVRPQVVTPGFIGANGGFISTAVQQVRPQVVAPGVQIVGQPIQTFPGQYPQVVGYGQVKSQGVVGQGGYAVNENTPGSSPASTMTAEGQGVVTQGIYPGQLAQSQTSPQTPTTTGQAMYQPSYANSLPQTTTLPMRLRFTR